MTHLLLTNCRLLDGRLADLLVGDGKIQEIRSSGSLRPDGAEVIGLEGRAICPGFIDAHTHFVTLGMRKERPDLEGAGSRGEALDWLAQGARGLPVDEWVVGYAWEESPWLKPWYLTREELDRAVPDHPALAIRIDGHLGVVNSLALSLLAVLPETRGLECDAEGTPTGVLREEALEAALQVIRPRGEALRQAIGTASREAARLGVTSVHDMVNLLYLEGYLDAHREGVLGVRAALYLKEPEWKAWWEARDQYPSFPGWLEVKGVKLFADGSLGARTAALSHPYGDDSSSRGWLLLESEELKEKVRLIDRHGLQLAVHAIGDRAIEAVLEAYEELPPGAVRHRRHRIEHLGLLRPDQADRVERLGAVASVQPNFMAGLAGKKEFYRRCLGPEWRPEHNPLDRLAGREVHMAFGSDCIPFSPLYGLEAAVRHGLHPLRAIEAYTEGGAYAGRAEDWEGRIAPGYAADLVVLSKDPLDREALGEAEVVLTILDGRIVFRSLP